MRLIPLGRLAIRYVVIAMLCAYALGAAFLEIVQAQQPRSVTDGVYSDGQATRGQQLYKAQCAECHGNAMEGTIGSPLTGMFSFKLERASVDASCRQDSKDDALRDAWKPLSSAINGPRGLYSLSLASSPRDRTQLNEPMLAQIVFPATIRPAIRSLVEQV